MLLHNSQSLKRCKVKTKLWVPETLWKIVCQGYDKYSFRHQKNPSAYWKQIIRMLKTADKDHQNDLGVKTKNTFPPIHGCSSSENTGTGSLIKHYRFLQKIQWRPFLRDHLKLIQTKTERTRQSSKQTSITNIIFGHYHCIYTAYQPIEETVAKILMSQSPFRNAFPQSGNVGISIGSLMLLQWLEGKKPEQFNEKIICFYTNFSNQQPINHEAWKPTHSTFLLTAQTNKRRGETTFCRNTPKTLQAAGVKYSFILHENALYSNLLQLPYPKCL